MHPEENEKAMLAAVSQQWGLDIVRRRVDIPLAGSPERSAWRGVLETRDQRLFVLERIHSAMYDRKQRIARTLQVLYDRGLRRIIPYLPDRDGDPLPLIRHGLWQLSPYIGGVVLNRPAYATDGWRGDEAGEFLAQLHRFASPPPVETPSPVFSIARYIEDLLTTLQRRHPAVADRYRPFVAHLRTTLFLHIDDLPRGFCHGDVHPINIIWGRRSIRAVIDWEFCGIQPEIYDLANLLGCLGIEDPGSLDGPFACRLIDRLRRSAVYQEASWKALPDLMLAIRFGWLSEWLRKGDQPMIHLEADYMAILMRRTQDLRTAG